MDIADMMSTAIVVVLMPPAVEPGLPPMNIKTIASMPPAPERVPEETVLKPAVRGHIDITRAARILVPTLWLPMLAGLFHSKAINSAQPAMMRLAVVVKTTLE